MRRAFGDGDDDARADRRPEAGDLRVPRRRRLRLPRGRARRAGARATLDVNWRSDQGLLDAYDALFGGAQLGHEGIVYRARARGAREPGAAADRRARSTRRCASASSHRDEPALGHHASGFARKRLGARAHRERPRGRPRRRCSRRRRDRDRDDDGEARRRTRPPRRTSPCSCARTATPRWSATRSRTPAIPAVINGAGSVFGTTPARDWLRLLEALERPASAPRARAAALTPFLGWTRGAGRRGRRRRAGRSVHRRLHALGAACCARAGVAVADRDDHARRGPARARAAPRRRRAPPHRPAPRRPAAARRGDRREQLGVTGAHGLAAPADRRGRATTPATRSAAAAWSPTPRPSRSSRSTAARASSSRSSTARTCGSRRVIPRRPSRSSSTIPTRATRARSTSASRAPTSAGHRDQHDRRAARRGPAARLRRAHPRAAPGGRLVGRVVGQPQLRRSAGCCSRATPTATIAAGGPVDADRRRCDARFEELAARGAGLHQRRARGARGAVRVAEDPRTPAPSSRPRASTATSTGAGGARPTATSPRAPTRRAWRASPRSASSTTSRPRPAPAAAPWRRRGRERCAPSRRCSREMPVGVARRHVRARRLRGRPTSPRPTSTPSSRARSTRRRRGAPSRSATATACVAGLRRGDRDAARPAARRRAGCATSRAADRLDELDFELPLAGGDDPSGQRRRSRRSARVLRERPPPAIRSPATPSASTTRRCASSVPRLPHRQHRPRRAAPRTTASPSSTTRRTGSAAPDEELTAWHYRPAALAAEMRAPHYGLQALLYTVALHRYLRWRLPGYDPDAQPRRRPLPVPARDDRAGHADRRRRALRRVRVAAAGARSSTRSATCSTAGERG